MKNSGEGGCLFCLFRMELFSEIKKRGVPLYQAPKSRKVNPGQSFLIVTDKIRQNTNDL